MEIEDLLEEAEKDPILRALRRFAASHRRCLSTEQREDEKRSAFAFLVKVCSECAEKLSFAKRYWGAYKEFCEKDLCYSEGINLVLQSSSP